MTCRPLLLLLMLLLLTGCRKQQPELEVCNAVYYWRTDLCLDSTERAFLQQHNIKKVYCRYFDVVMKESSSRYEEPMPNATLTFSDTLPGGVEMVPTVYITEDCMHNRHEGLARKLVERIRQMNETNNISGVKEIQIDCDYTSRSRKIYYEFLKEVSQEWPIVSTTIRLHQLQMPAPPVDYGVLMLYNTGDPRRFMERNPVLDLRDVKPYLRYLADYPLPLSAAYPVYQWVRHIHGVRVEHTVDSTEILRVKQAVENERPELRRTILTYHLDKENINRYDTKTYEKIYRH